MSLIDVKNLSVGYEKKVITGNISFSVKEGDYLYIVGENGGGKSTLMKTILKLIPSLSGTMEFGDGLMPFQIGYLPQQTQVQKDFPASVEEIVLSGCLNQCGLHPFYRREQKEKAVQFMEQLKITDLRKKCYRELSGGQQQRVLLARALCASQRILLMDEPVAGLDPATTRNMYEMVAQINQDGMTVIMISHDVEAAIKYATKILYVSEKTCFYEDKYAYRNGEIMKYLRKESENE